MLRLATPGHAIVCAPDVVEEVGRSDHCVSRDARGRTGGVSRRTATTLHPSARCRDDLVVLPAHHVCAIAEHNTLEVRPRCPVRAAILGDLRPGDAVISTLPDVAPDLAVAGNRNRRTWSARRSSSHEDELLIDLDNLQARSPRPRRSLLDKSPLGLVEKARLRRLGKGGERSHTSRKQGQQRASKGSAHWRAHTLGRRHSGHA
mmetsp:Transcript_24803/g.77698  ORF Transcript_24803/g.77698 Transcript_24803/m.77698 type:complete len:204 (-) Transcript_24803:8-619(-)